ncbi:MAG TPA: SH3 domain-containing protein [Candidatus Cybelea sp.]|nr:SH3 domain-containing protein [Candidatus Cybelea sp.]
MRKISIGFALFVIMAVAAYLRFHRPKQALEIAYAGNRQVTLWNTTATVREPVTTVPFGERLDVLVRYEGQAEVRTDKGSTGWVSDRELLTSEVWDRALEWTKQAENMPVEARGHTRVLSNLHVEAGRNTPRLRQLNKDVPVDLLERTTATIPAKNESGGEADPAPGASPGKTEDWWLIVAHTPDQGAVGGWMLGRFIDLDVPQPLPDYASSAAMRIVAWFELNRVRDAAGGLKPQYLLLGDRGPEGRPCDFRLIRVFTWGAKRARYETAFIDSDVCGKLPVAVTHASPIDLTFSFQNLDGAASTARTYRMQQTIVRLVRARAKPKTPRGTRG